MMPVTFLCTCGGGPGILAQVAALKSSTKYDARVILADANPAAGNLFLPDVDAAYRIPNCDSSDFIPALVRLIKREGVDFLYSGLDEEMPVIERNRSVLESAGCRFLLPPAPALEAALDKVRTWRLLDGKVRMPSTWLIDESFDADTTWQTLGGTAVIKVASSRGGRHVYVCEDRDEYDYVLRRVKRLREEGLTFIVQAFIEGDEYNVTSLHDLSGQQVYAFSRRKFEARKVKSTTVAARVERNDDVIAQAVAAVRWMGLATGFNNSEIIVSKADGLPYFIEVNGGRTAAQDMNVVASGVNITDLMMDLLGGAKVAPLPHIPDGLCILKIRKDVVVPYAAIEAVPEP